MSRKRRAKGAGGLYRREYSLYWWMRVSINGCEHRESTRKTNWNDAMKVLNARIAAIRGGTAQPSSGGVRVAPLLDGLSADYELHERASTKTVQGHIKVLKAALGSRRAADVGYADLQALAIQWQKDDLTNATINRRMAALRRAFRLGRRAGLIKEVPEFPSFRENNVRQGFVEESDMVRFLGYLPDDGLRDFVQWLATTGMRRGEAMKLKWSYLHKTSTGLELRIPGSDTKNRRDRVIPIVGDLAPIVQRRRKARRFECPLIFHRDGKRIWEFRKSWRSAAKAAGCAIPLPHDLRRSAIRTLRLSGVDRETAKKISGHVTDSVFQRYNIVTTGDVANALKRATQYRHATVAKGMQKREKRQTEGH